MIWRDSRRAISRNRGFTLIELMVAMVSGLLVIGISIYIFLANKQNFLMQEASAQIQENSRFVLDTLQFRLRMMGYTGCYGDLSSVGENVLNNPSDFAWNLSNSIEGFDNVASTETIGGITNFTAGSDVLVLRGMGDGVPLSVSSDSNQFKIDSGNNRFEVGDNLLVTSCDEASFFQATGVSTNGDVTTITHTASGSMTPGNQTGTLALLYKTEAEIARLETFVYYIATGENGRSALFEARLVVSGGDTLSLQSTELTQNIDNMQIIYGVDTDSDREVDAYQGAGSVTNWQQVLSVRLSLMVASDNDSVVSSPHSYSFDSTAFNYTKDDTASSDADRHLRRSFNAFVALRNRVL